MKFTITTANTLFGRAIYKPNGILSTIDSDIFALQEVTGSIQKLETIFANHNYKIQAYDRRFGLLIATKNSGEFSIVQDSIKKVSKNKPDVLVRKFSGDSSGWPN